MANIKTFALNACDNVSTEDFSEYAVCNEICKRIQMRLDTYNVKAILLHEIGGASMSERRDWCLANDVKCILSISMKYDLDEEFSTVTAFESMFYDRTWRYKPIELAERVAKALGKPEEFMGDQTRNTLINIPTIKGVQLEIGNAAFDDIYQNDIDTFCTVISDAVAVWVAKELFLSFKRDTDDIVPRYYVRYWWWHKATEALWTTNYEYAKKRADQELGLKVYNQYGVEIYNSEYTMITALELPAICIEGATISQNGTPILNNLDHPEIIHTLTLGTTVTIIGERKGDYRRVRVKINGLDVNGYVKIPFLQYNNKEVVRQ